MIPQGGADLEWLVGRIRREFPDLRFAEARLNDEGEDHAVVQLDRDWIFRFARSPAVAARAETERRLLSALSEATPVPTPRYVHVARAGDFGGYRMIAGEPLSDQRFRAAPGAAQERMLGEVGDFLGALHGLPLDLAPAGEARREDAVWFQARYAERRSRLIEALGSLIAPADRFYAALPAAVASDETRIIHRDFTEDHILVDPLTGRLAGIIDFTDAGLGDPAFDFTFLWVYGRRAPEQAARRYGAVSERLLARSLWWFVRYRIDQIWWSVSGARAYDVAAIRSELEGLFGRLGV